jgi:hemerythrin-like domain-containing protein
MLHYIEAFPETLHHPKEDGYLHPRIRARSPGGAALLDALEVEHVRTRELATDLVTTLADYEQSGSAAFPAFAAAVRAYADFTWTHMQREEDEVLPLAQRILLPEDWAEIDQAFAANRDPIVAGEVSQEFRQLFRKIVTLAPPPIGVGPERPG